MTSPEVRVFACGCCRLPQAAAIDKTTGVTVRVCADCTHHQGDQAQKRVQRAESHERMLRERMDMCRTSEAKARSAASLAAKNADEAYERMKAALRSRSNLAARIVDAAGESLITAVSRWTSRVIHASCNGRGARRRLSRLTMTRTREPPLERARARYVPDGPVNRHASRALTDKPTGLPTCGCAGETPSPHSFPS